MSTLLDGADVDEVAVLRFLQGQPVRLNPDEQLAVIVAGVRRGRPWSEIDALFGRRPGAAQRRLLRANERALARGLDPFPLRPRVERALSPERVVEVRWLAALGGSEPALAGQCGVTRQTMRRLLAGVTYRDCGGPLLPSPLRSRREWPVPERRAWRGGWNSTAIAS